MSGNNFGRGRYGDVGAVAYGARRRLLQEHFESILVVYLAAATEMRDPIIVLFDPKDSLGRRFCDEGEEKLTIKAFDREEVASRCAAHGGMDERVFQGLCHDSIRGVLTVLCIASGGAMYTHPQMGGAS